MPVGHTGFSEVELVVHVGHTAGGVRPVGHTEFSEGSWEVAMAAVEQPGQ